MEFFRPSRGLFDVGYNDVQVCPSAAHANMGCSFESIIGSTLQNMAMVIFKKEKTRKMEERITGRECIVGLIIVEMKSGLVVLAG